MGVIVTGMHRSGTSAVARVLHGIGLTTESLDMAPAPDNPRGFFESHGVMAFNDGWLQRLGGSWWAPPNTSTQTWGRLDATVLQESRKQLDLFDPCHDDWFVKDPRLSLLLPLWDRLTLQNLPVIFCVRDPRDSANSLHLRDGMSPRRSLALWMAYVHSALSALAERHFMVVDYGQLLADREATVEEIVSFLHQAGFDLSSRKTAARLHSLIEPELQRSRHASLRGASAAELDDALEIYGLLSKAHCDSGDNSPECPELPNWVTQTLDELREVFELERRTIEAANLVAQLRSELSDLAEGDRDVAQLGQQLEHWKQRVGEVEEDRFALEVESADLRERLAAVDAERHLLDHRLSSIEEERAQAFMWKQELTLLTTETNELRALLGSAQERCVVLAAERKAVLSRLEDTEGAYREQLARAFDELSESRREIAETYKSFSAEIQLRDERIAELLNSSRLFEEQQAAVRAELHAAESDRLVLSDATRLVHEQLVERELELSQGREEVTVLQERLVQAINHIDDLQGSIRVSSAQVTEAEQAIRDLQTTLELERAGSNDLVKGIARKEDEARVLSRTLDDAEQRIVCLEEDLARAQSILVAKSTELRQLAGERIRLEQQNSELTQAKMQCSEALSHLSAACERLRAELVHARREANQAENLRLYLLVESSQRVRLQQALVESLQRGQELSDRLDGVLASRSYRYGRKLTAPGRLLFAGGAVDGKDCR